MRNLPLIILLLLASATSEKFTKDSLLDSKKKSDFCKLYTCEATGSGSGIQEHGKVWTDKTKPGFLEVEKFEYSITVAHQKIFVAFGIISKAKATTNTEQPAIQQGIKLSESLPHSIYTSRIYNLDDISSDSFKYFSDELSFIGIKSIKYDVYTDCASKVPIQVDKRHSDYMTLLDVRKVAFKSGVVEFTCLRRTSLDPRNNYLNQKDYLLLSAKLIPASSPWTR